MSFKSDKEYYGSRLKNPSLLDRAVKVKVGSDRFLCVPCDEERVTGFTHFLKTETEALIVYRTLVNSKERFPGLRVEPVENAFGDNMFMVKWGMDEPDRRFWCGWDFEVAIAKQLGYSDACMPAHYERMTAFYGRYF
jgi:hypothetical protein